MHAQDTQEPIGSPKGRSYPLVVKPCTLCDIVKHSCFFVFQAKSLEAYLPPAWILQTKPTLSPYLPQVGDVVSSHLV